MKKFMYNMIVALVAILLYAVLWEKVNYPTETAFEVIGYVFEAENVNAFVEMAGAVAATQMIVDWVAKLRTSKAVEKEEAHKPVEHASFMTVDQVRQMPRPARPKKPHVAEEV